MIYFCGNRRSLSDIPEVSPQYILEYFKDHKEVALDTETKGRCPHSKKILALQLGDDDNQFVIDVRAVNILLFKELIEKKKCLAHNAKFDYKFLLHAGIVMEDIYDTMLAEIVIFNGFNRGYSLADLHWNHLGVNLEKDTRGEFYKLNDEPFTDRQIRYAALDVANLMRLKKKQEAYIRKFDLKYAVGLENKAVTSFADIEYNGMLLNPTEWKSAAHQNRVELDEIRRKLDKYLIDRKYFRPSGEMDLFGQELRQIKVNYDSPSQMLKICNEKEGLNLETTEDRELQKHKGNEFIDMLLTHREISKRDSTYGLNFLKNINPTTKRVHTDFWQIKHTFRVGSSDPNLQNIPSKVPQFRACFKPRPGYKWVAIDYAGQEMRIMADFSNEHKMIAPINEGKDIHCHVASEVFETEVTKADKGKRDLMKSINFMKPYGGGPEKLTDLMGIPLDKSKELFFAYNMKFPLLNTWLVKQAKFGVDNGYIVTNSIHKGRRWFKEHKEMLDGNWRYKGNIERQSMNTPIQGTGAVVVKHAMYRSRKYLRDNGYWQKSVFMIGQVHDEVIYEIKEDMVETIVPKIKNIMVEVGNIYVSKVNMAVDATISDKWLKE